MSPESSRKTEKQASKTATVEVIKDGIRCGNHLCAAGHIIPDMDIDEVKLRTEAGEIQLIKVN